MADEPTAIVELAKERSRRRRKGNGGPAEKDKRPLIRLIPGQINKTVDAVDQLLAAGAFDLYRRGGMVVKPVLSEIKTADGGTAMALRLVRPSGLHISECVTKGARIERMDARVKDWVSVDCPPRVAEMWLAREGQWGVSALRGLAYVPIFRPDGSIADRQGYDSKTGLLIEFFGETFPPIAARPSREDAMRALGLLIDLVNTFPFVEGAEGHPGEDLSVLLSAILTAVTRQTLPSAPAHAFSAPVAGTGKSIAVDIVSVIATGRPAAVISQSRSDEEMEKRLGGALLAGDAIISIDNCEFPLGGGLLCQATTQPEVKIRLLGVNTNIDTPISSALFATGNNLVLAGDMTRRTLLCSLDPYCERPELRTFAVDPVEKARNGRALYVAACLTILRAHHVAGRPGNSVPLGSFEEWSRRVRDALLWLGQRDPVDTMQKTRAADPRLGALTAIIEQWSEVIGEHGVFVSDVIKRANEVVFAPSGDRYAHPDLREALLQVAGEGDKLNARRLGRWLAANQGRIVDAKRIVQSGVRGGMIYWRLELAERP